MHQEADFAVAAVRATLADVAQAMIDNDPGAVDGALDRFEGLVAATGGVAARQRNVLAACLAFARDFRRVSGLADETGRSQGRHVYTFVNVLHRIGAAVSRMHPADSGVDFNRTVYELVASLTVKDHAVAGRLVDACLDRLLKSVDGALLAAEALEGGERHREALAAAEAAVALDPAHAEARAVRDRLHRHLDIAGRRRLESGRWPTSSARFADLEQVVREQVLADPPFDGPFLTRRSRVVALGSCFAINLAAALATQGVDVYGFPMAEEVNNTFLNRYVLAMVQALGRGAGDAQAAEALALKAEDLERLAAELSGADLTIFTLGVSYGFFGRDNGRPVLMGGFGAVNRAMLDKIHFRQIPFADNVANIRKIVAILKAMNPAMRVVLTLSPVPIHRVFGRKATVVSDCLSKSNLRLSIDAAMADGMPDVHYWPSFEIVKWLAPHVPDGAGVRSAFGADDGHARHVSKWAIDLNVRLFLEYAGFFRDSANATTERQ